MANTFGPMVSMRSGRRSVRACPMALASWMGATTVMSPNGASVSASSRIPSEWTPSSLVTRMRGMGNIDDSTRFLACLGRPGPLPLSADNDDRLNAPRPSPTPAPQPAALGHRPLQPALQLLHAGGGVRVAAARGHPGLRRDRASGGRVRLAGREQGAPHRRRAAAPPGRDRSRAPAGGPAGHRRPGDDHQRRAARGARRPRSRRRGCTG